MRWICIVTVAPLRVAPEHTSEMVSQVLWGEVVLPLEPGESWSLVKTSEGYSGYIRTSHIKRKENLSEHEVPAQIQNTQAILLEDGSHQVLLNGSLVWPDLTGNFENQLKHLESLPEHPVFRPDPFVLTAKECLNIPYLWGGRSEWGMDCSGLVQFCLQKMGFDFPRDAWQQAEVSGMDIHVNPIHEILPGELLFFKRENKRIHHIAISLGNGDYIHASEWVRINSLDPDAPLFDPDRKATWIGSGSLTQCRLIPRSQAIKALRNT